MGAYEWNPTVGVRETIKDENDKKMLCVAPNPFLTNTTITLHIKTKVNIEVLIFNNNGQLVKKLLKNTMPPSVSKIKWDGTDNRGNNCKPGLYHVVLNVNEILTDDGIGPKLATRFIPGEYGVVHIVAGAALP